MNKRKYIVVFVIVLLLAAVVGLFHTFLFLPAAKKFIMVSSAQVSIR